MTRQLCISRRHLGIRIEFIIFALFAFVALPLSSGLGADLADQAHSLHKVPADAAFYSASLRLREQWHAFKNSKAYSKLMEIPLIQFAKMQVEFQWQQSEEPTLAKFRDYIQSAPGKDAVAVLKEMFSEETFTYVGSDITESIRLFMELNSLRRSSSVAPPGEEDNPHEIAVNRIMEILRKHADTFKVPTMVFGFRVKDQARAKRELDEVHSLLRNVLDEKQPDLAAHLQRDQIGGHEFLTLRLDGSMLPWDKIREDGTRMLDDKQFDQLRSFVSKHKLVVALGVVDEFILLSFSEATDHLERMGKGPVLAELAAIKRLQKHADQRVVSVQFVSKAFAQSLGSAHQTLEDLASAAEQGLAKAKVSEEHRKQIVADIRGLNLARYMPQPSDTAGVTYLTPRGYEAFQYSDSTRPMMDSSKPLTILKHVGGNPMVVVASRSKQNIKDYEQFVAWLKQTAVHIEQIAEEKANPEDWAKYQEYRKRGIALLERLDLANREYLYPALADGQAAFVLDFSAMSKQWFKRMPESPKPLPMLELGFAAGVSDAEKLRAGVSAYIDVARDAYKLAKEIHPHDMPDLKMPRATVSELSAGGKLYSYPLPKKWGVDPQVAVNAGLSSSIVAVSTMPKTTERLLRETTPDIRYVAEIRPPGGARNAH